MVILSSKQEIEEVKEKILEDLTYYPLVTERNFSLFDNTSSFMSFEVERKRCSLRYQVYKAVKENLKKAYTNFAAKYEM